MRKLNSKKFLPLSDLEMKQIAGGQKKWVTVKIYYDQWRCIDRDCNTIIVCSVQFQELQNNKGEVFGARQVYDDNNGN